jgi:hypothetical protein
MINPFWSEPRSTYHTTCVSRVKTYLKKKCGEAHADSERALISGYRLDAFGHDRRSRTWYLCEIKVNPSDLKKATQQIQDYKFHFPKTKYYHSGDVIVTVIAVPAKLAKYLIKTNEWDSFKNTCKILNVSIWVIEQSTIQEVTGNKTKKAVKTKSVKAPTTRKKITRTKKTSAKNRVTTSRKVRKTKTSKKMTAKPKKAKLSKRPIKSVKVKKKTIKSVKRKSPRMKVTKAKTTRKKR